MPSIHSIYRPFLKYFRATRIQTFFHTLNITERTSVVDIGGNGFFWNMVSDLGLKRPKNITILNIYDQDEELPEGIRWVRADARNTDFENGRFDVAFSNSVIEHLETHESQTAMAEEIRRIAKRYWVQTPDPRFPVEPHYLTPFVHWLPKGARRRVLRNGTVWGLMTRPTEREIDERLQEIRLIPPAEFRALFPDGKVLIERFAGLPKSMIAVR
jgi:hypothetical protein